jgi:hypothetical protein
MANIETKQERKDEGGICGHDFVDRKLPIITAT